jgi:putative phage-type endonuclease
MSLATIPKPVERTAWLKARHGHANASDAAVYVGRHPYKTLADLAAEKLAAEPVENGNRATERGNRLEAAVADWWADEHSVAIYEPTVMYACGRLLANLDRGFVGNDREALEVKTTRHEVDGVTDYWWWQAQAQMACADLERVHFAVLDGSMDLRSFTVDREQHAIDELLAAVEYVWAYLDLGMVPEGVHLTAEHVVSMHPTADVGKWVDLDDEQICAVALWERKRRARVDAEKREQIAKDEVARLLTDAEGARYHGLPVVTWRSNKPSRKPDWKALTAEHPDLVGQFTREVPGSRVMRPTKEIATFDVDMVTEAGER